LDATWAGASNAAELIGLLASDGPVLVPPPRTRVSYSRVTASMS